MKKTFIICMALYTPFALSCGKKAKKKALVDADYSAEVAEQEKSKKAELIYLHEFAKKQDNYETALQELIDTHKAVVLDFYADWCAPCRELGKVLDKVIKKVSNVLFVKINIDTCKSVANKYGVRSIPLIVTFKNGSQVKKEAGRKSEKELLRLVEELL